MWWSNRKTTRTRMADPENGIPERYEGEGLKGSSFLGVCCGAGVLAALLSRSDVVRGIVRVGEVADVK